MFHTDTLSVKPITYQLDLDEQTIKRLRPCFKLHSGSYSRITKTCNKHGEGEGSHKCDDEVKIRRKEKGNVTIELWDGSTSKSGNLIGRGQLKYDSLSSKEGQYEEWVPLCDSNGKQVGKALVEVKICPVEQNLSLDDTFKRSIGDLDFSFRRALEDMNRSFDHFNRFALPGIEQPSITGQKQGTIESGKDTTSTTTQSDKQLSTQTDDKNKLWSQKRNLFDSTFDDMNNMFERTLEEMHNRFEDMTRDFFSGFGGFGGKGVESGKSQNIQQEKSKYGQQTGTSGTTTTQGTQQQQTGQRDRGQDVKNTNQNVEIKDETFKNVQP